MTTTRRSKQSDTSRRRIAAVARIDAVLPGSIVVCHVRCGKANCACARRLRDLLAQVEAVSLKAMEAAEGWDRPGRHDRPCSRRMSGAIWSRIVIRAGGWPWTLRWRSERRVRRGR